MPTRRLALCQGAVVITLQNAAAFLSIDAGDAVRLVWAGSRLESADPSAKRAIGRGSGRDDVSRLLSGIAIDDGDVEHDLRVALRTGRAIEVETTRSCGGDAIIRGRPIGRRVEMTLHLSDGGPTAMSAEALLCAAQTSANPLWLRAADGSVRWRNPACARSELDLSDPRLAAAAATASATNAEQSLRLPNAEERVLVATESPGGLGLATIAPPAVESLKASAAHDAAASAVEHLSMAVAVFGAGRRLLYANAVFHDFWNLSANRVAGHPRIESLLDRMRDSGRLPAIANFDIWRDEVASWADPLAEAPPEDDWHLSDGSTIRIERRVDDAARVLLSFQDITAQVALERRIRRVMNIQRKTLDALAGGVALFDPDGRLRLANAVFADLWAINPHRVRTGAHIAEIPAPCPSGDAADAWDGLRRAATGGPVGAARHRFFHGGRMLEASAAPMPDGSIMARIDDRTDAENVETALRERGEALEATAALRAALADCASVKLRTALTSLKGFAELSQQSCEDPTQSERLCSILSATDDMAAAICEIEQLAKTGEEDAPLSATDLLSTTEGVIARALWRANIRLRLDDESDGGTFLGEPETLRRIAVAMALAASDGLPPGRELHLSADRLHDNDDDGRRVVRLVAASNGPVDRPPLTGDFPGTLRLADRIGARLTVRDDNGRRVITLLSAPDSM